MIESHPQNRTIGYIRVSTYGQTLDAQFEQSKAAGCIKVYREKATGAQIERQEPQRMLKAMAPSDVVIVTRIDRLARSTCFPSSRASPTPVGNSGHWRSRGPTARPTPGA